VIMEGAEFCADLEGEFEGGSRRDERHGCPTS
jgi:hypothetical protein